MGANYSFLIHDEFDWGYAGYTKADAIAAQEKAMKGWGRLDGVSYYVTSLAPAAIDVVCTFQK